MGINSFCEKCCPCCKCFKKEKGNPLEAKIEKSVSSHNNFSEVPIMQMSLEEIKAHCQDMKNIYAYAVEAMKNFLGKPCYPFITQPKQLYPYILFLCEGLKDHEYVAIKQHISEKQLLNIQLTIMIKDAKVIHPKVTDFSRIFCKLWITNGEEQLTSMKDSSSYLLWDETFILDVLDYDTDIFHVEIWSSRPGFLEKLETFNFESFKKDDPLAEEEGMFFVGDAAEYVKESQVLWKNWLEILPNTALTLIQQHALQHGITATEQFLCSWLVTLSLKMRLEDRISFYLLQDLLEYLLENIDENEIGQMREVFAKSISDYSMFSLDMLRDLHTHFNVLNPEIADELYYMLRCMNICETKLTTSYIDSFEMIQEEAAEWYLKIIGDLKKELEADNSIEEMSNGLKNILKIYLKNNIVLDDIFMRAWNIGYTCMTYQKLDEVVCSTIQPMIKHLMVILEDPSKKRKASESLQMLQLYHTVRNLVTYMLNCVPSQRAIIRMDEFSNWFGEEMVLEWFLLCDIYTSPFIQRAVLADTLERLSPVILHGTSVADVASIIDEMVVEVWVKLKWKDQFYTHGALIEATKSCVLDYGTFILDRIKIEKFFCQAKLFEVSDKLCVAMSNVCAMAEHLHKTSTKIKNELKVAESALGFEVSEPLLSMLSDMQVIAAKIFLQVFEKIHKSLNTLFKKAINNNKTETGYLDLSSYVDNILEVLYRNLKKEIFYVILRHMWIVVLKGLKTGWKYTKCCFVTKKRKLRISMVILQTFNQMKSIFFCDGHGLTEKELENKLSEELKSNLEAQLKT